MSSRAVRTRSLVRAGLVGTLAGGLSVALLAAPADAASTPPPAARPFAVGVYHTAAVLPDGTVRAWGENDDGQLGDNTLTGRSAPVTVKAPNGSGALTGIVAVGTASRTTFAVHRDGRVFGWGENNEGQVGDGTRTKRRLPVTVTGPGGTGLLRDIVAISGGYEFAVALRADGTVWAWGDNADGQLGDGTTTDSTVPVQVKGPGGVGHLTRVVAIAGAVDGYHVVALRADGTVWAWGDNTEGQLGAGDMASSSVPVQVKGAAGTGYLTGVVEVAAGESFSMGRRADGSVWTWGHNGNGQLGDGTRIGSLVPVRVNGLARATAIGAGTRHALAVLADRTVRAWGNNGDGQLGDGSSDDAVAPVRVRGLNARAGVVAVNGGRRHSVSVAADGTIRSWGENYEGQLGDGTEYDSTAPVAARDLDPAGLPALRVMTRPKITGKKKVGKRLTAFAGTWRPAPVTVRYQWLRAGKPIPKATKSTYKLKVKDARKKLAVRVSATRPGYPAGTATSAAVKVKPRR